MSSGGAAAQPVRDADQLMKLIQAAGAGEEKEVKRLLKWNFKNLDNCSWATFLKNGEIVVDGAPDCVNPLSAACKGGHVGVARLLLRAKATADGAPVVRPLNVAAEHGHASVVQLLLEAKASATARLQTTGETALDCARRQGHAACVALLDRDGKTHVPSATGEKLILAIRTGPTGDIALLKRLLKVRSRAHRHGADPPLHDVSDTLSSTRDGEGPGNGREGREA